MLGEVAERLRSWDGTLERTLELRSLVRALPDPKRKASDDVERAIFIARSAYASPSTSAPFLPQRFEADGLLARSLAPFLGDPALGAWPFHRPAEISDDDAEAWLPIVGRYAAPDDLIRSFIEVMFRTRRRATWVKASYAFAALAQRDAVMRARLVALVAQVFPSGLPEKNWSGGVLRAADGLGEDKVHEARHVLHLAAAFLASGPKDRALSGCSARRRARLPLPTGDASDASAVLLALRALASGAETRADVLPYLVARANETQADELQEAALREISEMPEVPEDVRQEFLTLLATPRWKDRSGLRQVDAIQSWLETARLLKRREASEGLLRLIDGAGPAVPLLRYVLDGVWSGDDTLVAAVLRRLRLVLDEDEWETSSTQVRSLRLAELLVLLESSELKAVPWPSLVRRTGVRLVKAPIEGTTAAAAVAQLALILAHRDEALAVLLRDREFDEKTTIALAAHPNGFISRQVAVRLEALLRNCRGPNVGDKQVRLLWNVLQRDPPTETFRHLSRNLRAQASPLRVLVDCMGDLDAARDAGKLDRVPECYRRAADAADLLCAAAAEGPHAPLRAVSAFLPGVLGLASSAPATVGSEEWRRALDEILVGDGKQVTSLVTWLSWLANAPIEPEGPAKKVVSTGAGRSDLALASSWERLKTQIRVVHDAEDAVAEADCETLEELMAEVCTPLAGLAWPESLLFQRVFDALEQWRKARMDSARRSRQASDRAVRMFDAGDELGAQALLESARLKELSPEAVHRFGRFLLAQLLFADARRLRTATEGRVGLPSLTSYLAPLLIGVAAGPFVVLDIGDGWNAMLDQPNRAGLYGTCGLALLMSFGLLAASLSANFAGSADTREAGSRWRRIVSRVLPVWVGLLLVATVASTVVLATLPNKHLSLETMVLWSSLSVFLGLFVGLMAQGRSLTAAPK